MTNYRNKIAAIHKKILEVYINSDGRSCLYQSISDTDDLKELIKPVSCSNEIIEFLSKNHVILNESGKDWGWEPSNFYKRNCIILREFINEINIVSLHSYVYDLFFIPFQMQIERQILGAYANFLCSQSEEQFQINHYEEAKKVSDICFLAKDYTVKKNLRNITAIYKMYPNFKSFICNDASALAWWNNRQSEMEENDHMLWRSSPNKPNGLLNFRSYSTACAEARNIFWKTLPTNEEITKNLSDEEFILVDHVFGISEITGRILDALTHEITAVKQSFYDEFLETCDPSKKHE